MFAREDLLLRWVVGEGYALGDVALETFHAGFEERLLVVVEVCEWVVGLFGTGCLGMLLVGRGFRGRRKDLRRVRQGRRRNRSRFLWRLLHRREHQGGRQMLG